MSLFLKMHNISSVSRFFALLLLLSDDLHTFVEEAEGDQAGRATLRRAHCTRTAFHWQDVKDPKHKHGKSNIVNLVHLSTAAYQREKHLKTCWRAFAVKN